MASAFAKDLSRSITKKIGRFVALAAIVGLGVGFYAGLRMTAPDMKVSADAYHDSTATMDLRIASTMGLSPSDVDAIASLDSINSVMPAYETDVIATLNGKQHTFRIHSLPGIATGEEARGDIASVETEAAYLNQLVVVEGRLPQKAGECVISADVVLETTPQIGDVITVDTGTGDLDSTLCARTLTVVGMVHSPYYVESASLGTSTLGSGIVQEYLYVTEATFADDYPITEVFATVAGAAKLKSTSDEYQQLVDAAADEVNAIAGEREGMRLEELKSEAQAQIDEARADLDQARSDTDAELDSALAQLNSAQAQITQSEATLAQSQQQYLSGVSQLQQQRESAEAQLNDAQTQIDAQQQELDAGKQALAQGTAEYEQGEAALAQKQQELDAQKRAYEESGVSDPATEAALAAAQQQIDATAAQLAASKETLDATDAKLAAGQEQLNQAQAQLDAQRASVNQQLDSAQQQLDSARAQIASGYAQLESGKREYVSGLEQYNSGKAEADLQLADAQQEIDDAQAEVDSIERPDWLVMDRTKNVGMVSFESDADRVDHIAGIFPLIFFLVAALVALTTMTRMVDEERVLIGTYKALGYARGRIALKYLLYAVAASGTGALIGILALGKTLPIIIMYAYAIIYYVPTAALSFDPAITALSAGLGIGITVFATAAAALAQLRESPASLMQPRAPKAGKRILIERIGPLWRRLSFSWKVTARNIFRYKKRFFMTLVGIAGCTALMLTGWGLRDSINDIIDTQFGQLVHYTAAITQEEDASEQDLARMASVLDNDELVSAYTQASYNIMLAIEADGSEDRVGLIVPKSNSDFSKVWTLRERLTHDPVELDAAGAGTAVLSEKLASNLSVGVGDTVSVAKQDAMGNAEGQHYALTVTGIVENYLHDYIFMSEAAFTQVFGEEPSYDMWYAVVGEDGATRDAFDAALSENGAVKNLAYNDETIKAYRSMLKSVDFIVVILVIAAALLAYIVLYNLTNINVEERTREIATLKVLGFTRRETYAYIFREILITVVLGCLVGLVLGVYLEGFVILSAEVDQAMFGRIIHPESFAISFALTVAFACLVLFFMRHKLARIDMVESLKSIE